MANDAEVMLNMAARLGAARAEAVRLLAAAVEAGAGVWMRNLSTGARALVTHEDTLTRLLTEGWTHDAPTAPAGDAPNEPIPPAEPQLVAAWARDPVNAALARQTAAEAAPSSDADGAAEAETPAKGKKGS